MDSREITLSSEGTASMSIPSSRQMVISTWWFQAAVITFALGFAHARLPCLPDLRGSSSHPAKGGRRRWKVLFTGDDVMAGQHVFQKFGLMQYGALWPRGLPGP